MALQLNTVSFGDFLRSLMKTRKSKDAKLVIGDATYWLTTWEKIDKAARMPEMLIKITGVEDIEGDGDETESYLLMVADIDGSGDVKRLAVRI